MHFAEWNEFWWNSVTGPRTFVARVVDFLLDKYMVALLVSDDLPWRHDMRNTMETAFRQKATIPNMMIHQIDAVDDCPPNLEPGRYLLQRFATAAVNRNYREKAGITVQKYMLQNAVLKNTIVWVKGLDAVQAGTWIGFCKEYAPPSVEDGLIILEIHGESTVTAMRRLKTVRLADFISRYDLQLFNSFILDERANDTEIWKQYISALAARLCEIDAEVSEKLINITNLRAEEPLDGIAQIAELTEYQHRGAGDSQHLLALFRAGASDEIYKRIWAAQVQTLFPLIEFERMSTVSKLSGEIQKALDIHVITQYSRRLTNPLDMELGTLVYLISHKSNAYNYYIYISDETLRNRIRFLHECRNLLAHADCLSVQQVYTLIEGTYGNNDPTGTLPE